MPDKSQIGMPSPDVLTQKEQTDGKTRAFVGNDTPVLPVPGLLKLESVRTAENVMPLTEKRVYPVDATGKHFETVEHSLISLDKKADGVPVLLLNAALTNGAWQSCETFYVAGEWEAAEGETKPAKGRKTA